jgi:hypothetical protein
MPRMERSSFRSTVGRVPYEWLSTAFAVLVLRGIEPYEVMQVLSGARRRPVPVRSPVGLPMLNICGRTRAGRPLIVTVRLAGGFDMEIAGARDMSDAEREEFESWETSS